ncbi:MAG: MFS transporter [Planctomycetes bacterium]|nr:MFS transporter [Planctomycetota bacterium]
MTQSAPDAKRDSAVGLGDARHAAGLSPTARRDLRSIAADGVFFSLMVGMGETYIPAFAIAAGFGEVVAGLVATLPMLAGAVVQLATPWGVRRLGSYRRWVVLCAVLQAFTFVPLIAGAAHGAIALPWLAVATIGYWAFGMATGPAWNTWVTSLVPAELRVRYFARRTGLAQGALLLAVVGGGLLLHWGRCRTVELPMFAAVFSAALLARTISARFLARQSEAPGLAAEHRAQPRRSALAAVRAAGSLRVLVYLVGVQIAVNFASPLFTPYMLGALRLSYLEFMLLTAAAFLARVVTLPLLGRVAHRHGTGWLLWFGALGVAPLPLLWLVSHNLAYLLVLQLFAGVAWGSVELATLLTFFEGLEERDRTRVLTLFNLANAAAISCGALAGCQLFAGLGRGPEAYAWAFSVSSAGRLSMILVLWHMRPARGILEMELRTLAVRPSAGALQRPILGTVHPEEPVPNPAAIEARSD